MGDITIQKLKALTGHFDPDMIFKAPLAKKGISSVPECLKMCSNLTVLDLSFNSLTSVEALAPLKHLKTLIVVSNQIEKLESFKNLQAVEQIYLQDNKVKFISELNHLAGLSNLTVLSLQSLSGEDKNPVCEMEPAMYRETVLRKIPQLRVLDEGWVCEAGNKFYGAVRTTFDDPDAEMIVLEEPTWARDLPWKEKPIHVKVKLDTTAVKAALDGCNKALTHADAEIQKARDRLAMAQTVLQEKLRQFKYHQPAQLSLPNPADSHPQPIQPQPDHLPSDRPSSRADKKHTDRPTSRHKRPTDIPPSQLDNLPLDRPTTPDRSPSLQKRPDRPPSKLDKQPPQLDNLPPDTPHTPQPDNLPLPRPTTPSRSPSRRKKPTDTPSQGDDLPSDRLPSRPNTPPTRRKKPVDTPSLSKDDVPSDRPPSQPATERPPSRHTPLSRADDVPSDRPPSQPITTERPSSRHRRNETKSKQHANLEET